MITTRTIRSLVQLLRSADLRGIIRRLRRRFSSRIVDLIDYPEWRERYVAISLEDQKRISARAEQLAGIPTVAFVLGSGGSLDTATTVESIVGQLDRNWTLRLSSPFALEASDPRISCDTPPRTSGTWVIPLEPGDIVEPTAVGAIRLVASPDVTAIYSDYDHITDAGERTMPHFRCGPNLEMLIGHDYLRPFLALRADHLPAGPIWNVSHEWTIGMLTKSPDQFRHLPFVLFGQRWRTPVSAPLPMQPSWPVPDPAPRVSILIPTRDRGRMLQRCLASITNLTDYPDIELVIVDHESTQRRARHVIDEYKTMSDCTVISFDGQFNFAAMMNRAAEASTGAVLCLLNNDTEVIESHWLAAMVGQLARPGVGVVGAHLLFPNGTVQHAGIHPGLGGMMGHGHKHLPADDPGYFGRLRVAHEVTAVTGACLLTKRSLWRRLGGLDEERLAVAYNDVDYCLRSRADGQRVVITPAACLVHHESISRGYDEDPKRQARLEREHATMSERWGSELVTDPAYNPNLNYSSTGFDLSTEPRVASIASLLLSQPVRLHRSVVNSVGDEG